MQYSLTTSQTTASPLLNNYLQNQYTYPPFITPTPVIQTPSSLNPNYPVSSLFIAPRARTSSNNTVSTNENTFVNYNHQIRYMLENDRFNSDWKINLVALKAQYSDLIEFKLAESISTHDTCFICNTLPISPILISGCQCGTSPNTANNPTSAFRTIKMASMVCMSHCGINTPICRNCSQPFTNQTTHPSFKDFAQNYQVQCQHCKTLVTVGKGLQGLIQHLTSHCQIPCKVCQVSIPFAQFAEHVAGCENKILTCPFSQEFLAKMETEKKTSFSSLPHVCNFSGKRGELQKHLEKEKCDRLKAVFEFCTSKISPCSHSDYSLIVRNRKSHVNNATQPETNNETAGKTEIETKVESNNEVEVDNINESEDETNNNEMIDEPAESVASTSEKSTKKFTSQPFPIPNLGNITWFGEIYYHDEPTKTWWPIRASVRNGKVWIRWTDLQAPISSSHTRQRNELECMAEHQYANFGVPSPKKFMPGVNISISGLQEWFENAWEIDDDWKQHRYYQWLKGDFLSACQAIKPDQISTTTSRSTMLVHRKRDRDDEKQISNKKVALIHRRPGAITEQILRVLFNSPNRNDIVGYSYERAMNHVKSLLDDSQKESWDAFVDSKGEKEAARDFGRGVSSSPYRSENKTICIR
jgi:hypothetical protein